MHDRQPCQKQPCTIIPVFLETKAISGRPGAPFHDVLYPRYPASQIALLISSSGLVSLALFARITRLTNSLFEVGGLNPFIGYEDYHPQRQIKPPLHPARPADRTRAASRIYVSPATDFLFLRHSDNTNKARCVFVES